MSLPVIVLGAGGHAKVLIDTLLACSVKVIGFTDPDSGKSEKTIMGLQWLGDDDLILEYPPSSIYLVNGVGSVGSTSHRRQIYDKFKYMGYAFASVIHPSVIIASGVRLSEGVQIMAGATIQVDSHIGQNTIINTRASVDHDCIIGSHVHLAPGVTLSGGVQVDDGVHIGSGATVIQGMRIGQNSIIGAGSLIIKNVPEGAMAVGVPARVMKT